MLNYVVTAVKPTRVDHFCAGKFTDTKYENMIKLSSNRLEVLKVVDGGLECVLDSNVNGDVLLLDLIRRNSYDPKKTDLLVMATRSCCKVFEWDPVGCDLLQRSFKSIPEPDRAYNRQFPPKLLLNPIGTIDQTKSLIGICVYDQQFEAIPFDMQGNLGTPFFIRITRLTKVDCYPEIKFLFNRPKPTIVVHRQTGFDTYAVTLKDKDSFTGPWNKPSPNCKETWYTFILPLPAPVFGFLEFSPGITAHYSESNHHHSITHEHTIISGDVIADYHCLLLDSDGCLQLLSLSIIDSTTYGTRTWLKFEYMNLGPTCVSGASKISIVGSHFLYVGSGHGDSKLLKMTFRLDHKKKMEKRKFSVMSSPRDGAKGPYFEPMVQFVNIGPIRDFCVVDLERLGQGTVVTLSGSIRENSLRIIRYGFVMNTLVSVKERGIAGLWSVQQRGFDFLVVTYPNGTRILAIDNEGVLKERNVKGFSCERETLYCHDAEYDQLVQVTSNSVRLCSWNAEILKHEIYFPSDHRIIVATANMNHVLCAGVRHLVYLQICDGKLNEIKRAEFNYNVSCLSLNPNREKLAAVGLWDDNCVVILSLPDLILLSKEHLGAVVVRSLLLCALEGISYLMCGLGDGNVVIFSVNSNTGKLTDRQKVSVGSLPLALCTFTFKNITHVFAASDKAAVIYSFKRKLLFSQLDLDMEEVNFTCHFNNSLVLANTNGIIVGMILSNPHIRTILLEDSVHHMCSQHYSGTLALCCVKYGKPQSSHAGRGSIQLLCDSTFKIMSRYSLRNLETGLSIVSCSLFDDDNVYYCVGTSYEDEADGSSSSSSSLWSSDDDVVEKKGRILVFVVENRQLELVAEKETNGSVESLICFNGKLLASVQKEIHLYNWIRNDYGAYMLELECKTDGFFSFPVLVTQGNVILVGSGTELRVSVLLYKPGSIEEILHSDFNWATGIVTLDHGKTSLLTDKKGNIVTMKKDKEGATAKNQLVGGYHVGQCINRIKRGSLVFQGPNCHASTGIFGTASGAIGIIASLPRDRYHFLDGLQSSLRRRVLHPGDHKEWRSDLHDEYGLFTGAVERVRGENYIDGDLIKLFLHLSPTTKKFVSHEVGVPVEELIGKVEELCKLEWGF